MASYDLSLFYGAIRHLSRGTNLCLGLALFSDRPAYEQSGGCVLRGEQEHVASRGVDIVIIPDRIERIEVLPVSRERVWDAITKREQLSQWLSMVRDMDFRVGGEINFTWENERSPYPGIIEVIEPPHRFAFRWAAYAIGHPELKLAPTASTRVSFTLEEIAEGTQLTLVESGFASSRHREQERGRMR